MPYSSEVTADKRAIIIACWNAGTRSIEIISRTAALTRDAARRVLVDAGMIEGEDAPADPQPVAAEVMAVPKGPPAFLHNG